MQSSYKNKKLPNWQKLKQKKLAASIFEKRAQILQGIREFFGQNGFLEVETPLLVKHPGTEPYLNLFRTQFEKEEKQEDAYLITSPELQMKKILAAGFSKIFQIGRSFRNGEWGGPTHNPEFAMLEWYRQPGDYLQIMQDTEDLILFVLKKLKRSFLLEYQGLKIDLTPPWPRQTVRELFQQSLQIDLNEYQDLQKFKTWAIKKGHHVTDNYEWNDIFFAVFLQAIEPNLAQTRPLFLYQYPATQAALCRPCAEDSFWAERFELYIGGIELCNAFSELTNPKQVRRNFETDLKLRQKLGKKTFDYDRDFVEAMGALKNCGGNALGIDRLVMLLLNQVDLQNVLFFPFRDL